MIKIIILTILGVILAIISFIDFFPTETRIKTELLSGMFLGPLIDLLSKKITDRFN